MIYLTNFKPKNVQISSAIFEPDQQANHGKTKLTGNSHAQSPGCTHSAPLVHAWDVIY